MGIQTLLMLALTSFSISATAAPSTTSTASLKISTIPGPKNYISRDPLRITQQSSQQKQQQQQRHRKRDIGGVHLCSEANFTGTCWSGTYPLETCVLLNDYAGHVLSFQPDEGTECYLMQGDCDSENVYGDYFSNSTGTSDLSDVSWIANAESYICFEPLDS